MTGESKLRVLVADDELLARKRLVRLLAAFDDVVFAGECASGDAVLSRVREGGVDLVLLDVQMPGLTGIEALGLLPENGPAVVLCTAHSDYALEAFEWGATDYVMKPVEATRLNKALARARAALRARDGEPLQAFAAPAAPAAAVALARVAIPTRDGIALVDTADITHVVLEEQLVSLVTLGGATFYSELALSEFEERLPPTFARVHRRALLNLDHVTKLEPIDTGGLIAHTRGGHRVEVSRKAARELKRRLRVR